MNANVNYVNFTLLIIELILANIPTNILHISNMFFKGCVKVSFHIIIQPISVFGSSFQVSHCSS